MAAPSTDGFAPEWLEYEKVLGQRPILGGSPQEIIDAFNGLIAAIAAQSPPPDPTVNTSDQDADGVPVRIYTPDSSRGKNLPVCVYYHGGGYLVGNLDSEDAWCRYIAKNTPCLVISVDYRLSSEHKWPAQIDDSVTAYKWAWHNCAKFGGDQSKVFTAGASAGGGLALSVCNQVIKSGNHLQVQGVVAMVPITAHPESVPAAYKSQYKAYNDNASDVPIIDADSMRIFYETVAVDPNDEKGFVTLSNNIHEFPPTYISTCGKDPLRDDGKVFEAMLQAEGVKTKSDYYDGFPHFFWLFPGIKGGEEFLANVVKGAQWVLSH